MSILNRSLYISCINSYIDPLKPVDKAIITHAHADHARAGHKNILATQDTINIMKIRYGEKCATNFQALAYGTPIFINNIKITLYPAGHILGSAQILLEDKKERVLVTGDYKTVEDDTVQNFELVETDTLITEATFGLPIFKHPNPNDEIKKLIKSVKYNNSICHLVGVYALGKAQRVINLLRKNNYDEVIYIHGALEKISKYYSSRNINLGRLVKINMKNINDTKGKIVLAPPSALKDKWARKLAPAKMCMASGWMTVKQRAKQRLIELPLVISDHADWFELTSTISNSNASKVWITHGREDALKYWCLKNNIQAEALSLYGRDEED